MSHQSDLISQDILAYLKQHEQKDLLRFLTCGNVDDGKSTLIGRLLHDSKLIYEDHLQAIERDSKKSGTQGDAIDLALLVDGLQAEREQGITIDVAYRYFSTDQRKFIIADTPGHEQYTRNMATGASTCDLAIILIDARHGVQTQTRRHSTIAALLGIRHLVVAINKMDLVDYSRDRFEQIQADYQQFAGQLGERRPQDIRFVPLSALNGDNVVNPSLHMPWYIGPTLMQLLESVEISRDTATDHFRLPVQYVNRPNLDFRGFAGTIAAGSVQVGDAVVALPSGRTSTVKSIVTFDGELQQAAAGQAVTLTLTDEIDISRGNMLAHVGHAPQLSRAISAMLVWMTEAPLVVGKLYDFKVGVQTVPGQVVAIDHRINVNTLEQVPADQLALNEIGAVTVQFDAPISFDRYVDSRLTGAFIVIDRLSNVTIGAGMVEGSVSVSRSQQPVSAEERAARLGQRPAVIGVPAAVWSQAQALERLLLEQGIVALAVGESSQINALKPAGLVLLVAEGQGDIEVQGTDLAAVCAQIAERVRL